MASGSIPLLQSVDRMAGTRLTDERLTKFRCEPVHELVAPVGSSRRKQSSQHNPVSIVAGVWPTSASSCIFGKCASMPKGFYLDRSHWPATIHAEQSERGGRGCSLSRERFGPFSMKIPSDDSASSGVENKVIARRQLG